MNELSLPIILFGLVISNVFLIFRIGDFESSVKAEIVRLVDSTVVKSGAGYSNSSEKRFGGGDSLSDNRQKMHKAREGQFLLRTRDVGTTPVYENLDPRLDNASDGTVLSVDDISIYAGREFSERNIGEYMDVEDYILD